MPDRPTNRPVQHLHAAGASYPNAWVRTEMFRSSRGQDGLPEWPAWCFLPMAAYYAMVSEDAGMDQLPPQRLPDVAKLAALGIWRYSQGVYRFDDAAGEALADTIMHGEMPVEVLLRLPEWCVYIETPARDWEGLPLYGFWCHLEWDAGTGRQELRLLLDTEGALIPQILHLGPWTVTEAVDRWVGEARRQSARMGMPLPQDIDVADMGAAIQPLLALVLYLCSDEPEIEDREHPGEKPGRPRPKRTKKGWRLFPAKKPRVWTVGAELGEKLRREVDVGTNRGVRPHLRRAHWHGYWSGPRDGDRRFRYHWLPPTLVQGRRLDMGNMTQQGDDRGDL